MWESSKIPSLEKETQLNNNWDVLAWKTKEEIQATKEDTSQEIIKNLHFGNFNGVISSILRKVKNPAKEVDMLKNARAADEYNQKKAIN